MNVISRTIKNDSKRHFNPSQQQPTGTSRSGVTEGRRNKLTSQDGDDDANVPRLQTDGEGGGRHVSEGGKGGSEGAGGRADMAAEPHKIRYNVLHSRPRLRQEEATREGRKWGGGGGGQTGPIACGGTVCNLLNRPGYL